MSHDQDEADFQEMVEQEQGGFDEYGLIFSGGRQERQFVTESLMEFFQDQWFRQILRKVKGGKEATVYCCRAEGHAAEAAALPSPLLAAKVYRPRMFRAMHNDWFYKQGRTAHDPEGKAVYRGKDLRVAQRQTRIGRKIDMASWCRWEYDTLRALHEAGADVPRPLAHATSAILMEYIGDESGAAPTLHGQALERHTAGELFDRLMWNVELALSHGRVHADLSAHNVLYWDGRGVVIDWPQAVDAYSHPQAQEMLGRDIERLCHYFARQGIERPAERIAADLWRRFLHGEL